MFAGVEQNRREFLRAAGAGLASVFLAGCASDGRVFASGGNKRPNFVFFLIDDMGWRDAGCFGSSFYETPNIDRLAREGMKFTDAYAACPVCSPTRASIMAGKYPARLDTTDWFGAPQPDNVQNHWTRNKPLLPAPYKEHLSLEEVTVAETLKEAGYATFFAGKWHLGPEGYWPEKQGFDVNKGGHYKGSPPGGYFSPYNNPRLSDGPVGEHLPDRLAGETCDFIREHREGPFLAYLSFYSVHTPLMSREDLKKKYLEKKEKLNISGAVWDERDGRKVRLAQEHAVYAGMVEAMDLAVGKVLDELDELGLAENTIVFFMSDNGGLSTSEGHPTSNRPLRAGKGWLYEGGIREPMIIKWPGQVKPGSVCAEPVISTDFYPTMLEMASLPARPKQHCDGKSLVPLCRQTGGLKRDAIYWHYPHYGNQGGSPSSAVRQGKWKLIQWYEDGRVELYDLEKDIGEKYDVSKVYPEITERLHDRLKAWLKAVDAKMPSPNPKGESKNK